jgi:exodeoxyribonuclease-5
MGCASCRGTGEIPTGKIRIWIYSPREDVLESDLIIIDEVSMLSDDLAQHLLKLKKPILVLGDVEGQLPPIEGTGAFVNRKPDFLLTEIHRYALTSPIAQLANIIRSTSNGQYLGWGFENPELIDQGLYLSPNPLEPNLISQLITQANFQAICGYNRTRLNITRLCRNYLKLSPSKPQPKEPLICLKNNYDLGILNGDQLTLNEILKEVDDEKWLISLNLDGREILAEAYKHHFLNAYLPKPIPFKPRRNFASSRRKALELDWSYIITCHKAQGSEYNNVLILDDGFYAWQADNRRRWIYTALTRARENLTITRFQPPTES